MAVINHSFLMILAFMTMIVCSASTLDRSDDNSNNKNYTSENAIHMTEIKIKVNSKTFTAKLLDNNSAKEFKEMLPITINMIELNGNEKYYDVANSLPTNSSKPQTVKSGDLMLYGSKTLVLFYKTFSTSYSYTKLGSIDDVKGLVDALGSANVTVTFEKE